MEVARGVHMELESPLLWCVGWDNEKGSKQIGSSVDVDCGIGRELDANWPVCVRCGGGELQRWWRVII